jgi:predicted O-methyltransferase YrrM
MWLGDLKNTPVRGMEVGTFRGESAEWFCDNILTHHDSEMHCVDWFEGSQEHRENHIDVSTTETDARARLERFKNVSIHVGKSQHILRDLAGPFAFAYIDGDHSSLGVMRDAVLAFDLLAVGGVMIFDDYQWTVMKNPLDCPKIGVDAFLQAYAQHLEVLTPTGWQIAVRKTHE